MLKTGRIKAGADMPTTVTRLEGLPDCFFGAAEVLSVKYWIHLAALVDVSLEHHVY
jgi:hypothetical protein